MGELVSYLKTCMVYASIPLMYLGISMLKLAYLVAPHVVLKGVKNMSNRLPGMEKILQNAESAADVNFFFSNEYIKVINLKMDPNEHVSEFAAKLNTNFSQLRDIIPNGEVVGVPADIGDRTDAVCAGIHNNAVRYTHLQYLKYFFMV